MIADLVDIQTIIPTIRVDLRYATRENFTGEVLYDFKSCLLDKVAAVKLRDVQEELERQGLGLKIWDGYRPLSAQKKMWRLVPDERYVSDPKKGGSHQRGRAVDVTLVTSEGQELEMPTLFDDFSKKAHRDYRGASEEALKNCALLEQVMERHNFVGLPTEWWHFEYTLF